MRSRRFEVQRFPFGIDISAPSRWLLTPFKMSPKTRTVKFKDHALRLRYTKNLNSILKAIEHNDMEISNIRFEQMLSCKQ